MFKFIQIRLFHPLNLKIEHNSNINVNKNEIEKKKERTKIVTLNKVKKQNCIHL